MSRAGEGLFRKYLPKGITERVSKTSLEFERVTGHFCTGNQRREYTHTSGTFAQHLRLEYVPEGFTGTFQECIRLVHSRVQQG